MNWQEDYYAGSSDYPCSGEDGRPDVSLDPWADPAYARTEDVEEEE